MCLEERFPWPLKHKRNSVPKKRMRGNKSLRVCPMVNNEAGSIHLECSQKTQLPAEMLGDQRSENGASPYPDFAGEHVKESGCGSALNEEKLGARILSSQSVCVCVHQAETEWGEKLKSRCWKCL